jgi:hypothetical protein
MSRADKDALRALRSRIREVLNRDWDPIGGCPEDEYDGHIGKVAAMLRDDASDEELLDYLKWAEVENMGLGSASNFDRRRAIRVISALRAIGTPP